MTCSWHFFYVLNFSLMFFSYPSEKPQKKITEVALMKGKIQNLTKNISMFESTFKFQISTSKTLSEALVG
jgi:hypothetical protein